MNILIRFNNYIFIFLWFFSCHYSGFLPILSTELIFELFCKFGLQVAKVVDDLLVEQG